jgi:hypothetical protein
LPIIKIYQYDLRFRVPVSSQTAKGSDKVSASQLAKLLVSATVLDFFGPYWVFDGVSLGWSPKELFPVGEYRSTTISLGSRRNGKPNEVDIEVRNVGTLDIGCLVNYLRNCRIDLNPTGIRSLENIFKWLYAIFRDDPSRRMFSRPNINAFFQRSRETSMTLASTSGVLEAIRGKYQPEISIGLLLKSQLTAVQGYFRPFS